MEFADMALELFLPVAFAIGYLLGSIPFGLILTLFVAWRTRVNLRDDRAAAGRTPS